VAQSGSRPAPRPLPPVAAAAMGHGTVDRMIVVAREVARATITLAQREASEQRQAAERQGREQGLQAGRQAGYAEGIKQAERDSERILQAAERAARELLAHSEEQIGQLACEVAAHLLGVQLRLNPEVVERAVLAVLQDVPPHSSVAIEVSSADYERAVEALPAFRNALGGEGAKVRVAEDEALPQGGLRVSGPGGVVERNWQEGLVAISQAFEEVAKRDV